MLFKINGDKLGAIKEVPFKYEKELQSLTETNLGTLFGLEFVCSEFERDSLRIDTLAFSPDTRSFVIVEYKREQSFSVVDQGVAYLSLLLNNKEVFLVEYNEKCGRSLKRNDIDWSQSKVVFVARTFTNYQQLASGFRDLPTELWQVRRYDGGFVIFEQIQARKSSVSLNALPPSISSEGVTREVKLYTEDDVVPKNELVRGLYESLRDRALSLDGNLRTHFTKNYVAFRHGDDWRNIWNVRFKASGLQVFLPRTQPSDLSDPKGKVTYLKDSLKNFNQHISTIEASTESDLDYVVFVIQQALERYRRTIEK